MFSKQTELDAGVFLLKGMEIFKNLPVVVQHSVFLAEFMKQLHKLLVPWTVDLILHAVGLYVFLLQAGKQPVQLPVKVFPVPARVKGVMGKFFEKI